MKNQTKFPKTSSLYFLILLLSVFPALSEAQEYSFPDHNNDYVVKLNVYETLLGDMVTNSSSVSLGLEKSIKEKLSIQQFIAYIFTNDDNDVSYLTIDVEKINGIRSGTQLRYYLQKNKPKLIGLYIGPELMYQYTYAKRHARVTEGEYPDEHSYVNTYHVNRHQFNLHFVLGYQGAIFKRFLLENSLGIGFRYVSSNSVGKHPSVDSENEILYQKEYNSGAKFFPSINFKICLGWSIK